MLKEVSIEVIRKCPNNCVHCSSMSNRTCEEIIDFNKFKEVVDGTHRLGIETICFSGGEPFLHPQIVEMVKYVSAKNIKSYIYTSGIYMDSNNRYDSLPKVILNEIAPYVTKLIFNVEAAKEETYNRIMGTNGCFSLMQKSVLDAVALNIMAEAHFVPMKLNIDQIDETIVLCKNIGISKISFLRLVSHGRAMNNLNEILLSNEENTLLNEKLIEISKNEVIDIRIGIPLAGEESKNRCEAANGKLNIKYDGGVYPCEVFKNNKIKFKEGIDVSNIFNEDILSIYTNSNYLKSVREYIKGFSCNPTCENCVGQYLIDNEEMVGEISGK